MANEKRLIDANALTENADVFTVHTKEYGSIEVIPVDAIGDAPTVDAVEVVHGRWYYRNPTDTLNEHLMCTACKCLFWKNIEEMVSYPYCPNCGAKMDGGNEDG